MAYLVERLDLENDITDLQNIERNENTQNNMLDKNDNDLYDTIGNHMTIYNGLPGLIMNIPELMVQNIEIVGLCICGLSLLKDIMAKVYFDSYYNLNNLDNIEDF